MRADKQTVTRLLKTARGQLDGILAMVEADRYCVDISNQILAKVNKEILKAHLRGCVRDALETGGGDAEGKIDELLRVLDKLDK